MKVNEVQCCFKSHWHLLHGWNHSLKCLVFHRRNKVTEVCKWWQNDDFWVTFPFKSCLLSSLFLGHKHTNMTTQCGVVVQGNATSQKARVKGSLWCHCSGGPARGRVCVCVCVCVCACMQSDPTGMMSAFVARLHSEQQIWPELSPEERSVRNCRLR